MAYGTANVDVIQSSTANVPVQFNDGNGTQVGTLCRAWVSYKGTSTQSIRASFNVSSVTVNGTGDYTINFTTALPDANYSANTSAGSGASTVGFSGPYGAVPTASAYRFVTTSPVTATDYAYVYCSVFR